MAEITPAVSTDDYFLDPAECPPPRGRKIHLATRNGVEVIGTWEDGGAYIGWRPLFRLTPAMKAKINRKT